MAYRNYSNQGNRQAYSNQGNRQAYSNQGNRQAYSNQGNRQGYRQESPRKQGYRESPRKQAYRESPRKQAYRQESPRKKATPVVSKKYIDDIVVSNQELEAKIEKAKQAPELKRNVFEELKAAEAQVSALEQKVEDAYYVDKNREMMGGQLEVTTKRIRELGDRLEEASTKNRDLDRQVEQKKKLEEDFNKVVDNMSQVMQQMEVAKERSKALENELRSARDREGELRSAKAKLRGMESELEQANRKLQRLESSLRNSIKKWRKEPGDYTRVVVNPGTSGSMTKATTDMYGRPFKGGVKNMQITDTRSANEHARKIDYKTRGTSEIGLRRTVLKLEREKNSKELKKELLLGQNDKLAKQVRIIKVAMRTMGVSLDGVRS